jgi:hypothetical protein
LREKHKKAIWKQMDRIQTIILNILFGKREKEKLIIKEIDDNT